MKLPRYLVQVISTSTSIKPTGRVTDDPYQLYWSTAHAGISLY